MYSSQTIGAASGGRSERQPSDFARPTGPCRWRRRASRPLPCAKSPCSRCFLSLSTSSGQPHCTFCPPAFLIWNRVRVLSAQLSRCAFCAPLQAAERRARRGGWQGDALPGASRQPKERFWALSSRSTPPRSTPQVFEYLDTDLKKFMDLTGRGPANPLPKTLVQVRGQIHKRSPLPSPATPALTSHPPPRRTSCTSCASAWRTFTATVSCTGRLPPSPLRIGSSPPSPRNRPHLRPPYALSGT